MAMAMGNVELTRTPSAHLGDAAGGRDAFASPEAADRRRSMARRRGETKSRGIRLGGIAMLLSMAGPAAAQVIPAEPAADPATVEALAPAPDEKLLAAIDAGDVAAVEQLIAGGVDLERRGAFDATPLHHAAKRGDVAILAALLRAGAPAEARNVGRLTPLHVAAARGHRDAARLLVANCAPLDALDALRRSPLHLAAQRGHIEIAEVVAFAGADLRAAKPSTPLRAAISFAQPAVVAMLREVDPLPPPAPEDVSEVAEGADDGGAPLDDESFDAERGADTGSTAEPAPDVAVGTATADAAVESPIRAGRAPVPDAGEPRRRYVREQLALLGYAARTDSELARALTAFKEAIGQVAPAAEAGQCLMEQLTLEVDLRAYRATRSGSGAAPSGAVPTAPAPSVPRVVPSAAPRIGPRP
jgi:hypothetical protein